MPKVLAAVLALKDRSLRRGFGGTGRLLTSLLVEQVFSMLLAPAMMVFHTTFVMTTLAGKPVSWSAQERGDRGIGFGEALWRHKWHVLLGLAWGAVILWLAPRYIWWLLPVLAGLILSVPLTMLTSRAGAGQWMRRHGLLLTPEETQPPVELAGLAERLSKPAVDMPMAQLCEPALRDDKARLADDIVATVPAAAAAASVAHANGGEYANGVVPETGEVVAEKPEVDPLFAEVGVPPRSPLPMEAAAPVYLRPKDALNSLQRMLGATSSAAS